MKKLSVLVLVLIMFTVLYSFSTRAYSKKDGDVDYKTAQELSYETITVTPGDTLWSIAQYFRGSKDIREVVYDLKEINHISGSIIQVGQEIKIPIE